MVLPNWAQMNFEYCSHARVTQLYLLNKGSIAEAYPAYT